MVKVNRVSLESIRREEILKAALNVIAERGSANVTLADIAKAYGCSKGGVTYYYSSKEALFKDVFTFFFDTIFQKTRERLDSCDTPLSKILSYSCFFDESSPENMMMYPLIYDAMAIASYDAEYRQTIHDWLKNWGDAALEVVREGKESGVFQIDDAEMAARTVAAAFYGLTTRWYLDRETYSTEWARKAMHYIVMSLLKVKTE